MDQRTRTLTGFSEPVMQITEKLAGKPIGEGEAIVEMARRLLWVQIFSGDSLETVARAFNASSAAASMAENLATLSEGSVFAVEEMLLEVRLCLYMAAYGSVPGTRFGDQMKSHIEEERRYTRHPNNLH